MIEIVNKKKHTPTDRDIYIGRGTALGNPYSHLEVSRAPIKVETREESIEKYSIWLEKMARNEESSVKESLDKIYEMHQEGTVYLVCHCDPKPCHGQVIKNFLLAREDSKSFMDYLWDAGSLAE